MNNMYDILGKMNLLEGKGSKPDFLDLDKDGNKKEPMKSAAKEVDEASYSAKSARAGKDIGKPGKAFAQIAKSAGERYGSKERGEKVAGAVLAKLRKTNEADMEEGNKFTGNLAKARASGKKMADLDGDGDMEPVREGNLEELDMNLIKAMQKGHKAWAKDPESERNIHKKYGYRGDREEESDDDYDEWGNKKTTKKKVGKADKDTGPKKKGRPAGSGRKLGAKGPTGKSKLLKKGSIKESSAGQVQQIYNELADIRAVAKQVQTGQGQFPQGFASRLENSIWAAMSLIQSQQPAGAQVREGDEEMISLVDKGEYDREGDMAKEQLHTIEAAAKELHDLLGDDQNLPEWVQSKITKAMDYIDTARDYMLSQEHDQEQIMPERKLSSSEKEEREDIVKGMKKNKAEFKKRYGKRGEEVMYATATKLAKERGPGNPDRKKKEESVEETTTAGAVATAPASGKGKKGMVFGKGVYESQLAESFEKKLGKVLTEGMSINMSVGEDGQKSLTVNATDSDAEQLAQILKMAGLGGQPGGCGCETTPCSCGQMDEGQEDVANAPEEETQTTNYMTKTIAGGLNKNKRDIAGNGQTTIPVSAVRVQEEADIESHLTKLYQQYKA